MSKQGVVDEVNVALSTGDCNKAIGLIEPVYNSGNTDNQIRFARAAAFACAAHFNFFGLIANLSDNLAKLPTRLIWNVFTEAFPSDPLDPYDRVVQGAEGATDALLASIRPSTVLDTGYLFNLGSPNPETGQYTDRTDESNAYLVFVSMATIGAYHNRFGKPDQNTFDKTVDLPWSTPTSEGMDTDGCGYASAIVNFADSLGGLQNSTSGSLATALGKVKDLFQAAIYTACNVGCHGGLTGIEPDGSATPGWLPSSCSVANGACEFCPATLRDRTSCQKKNSDLNSCAAAGIVNFMNKYDFGWQGPP